MFPKLFNRNNKTKENTQTEDTFSLAEMKEDGKMFLLRFKNNQLRFAERGKYPYQIGIATPLHTNNNGFPSKEENAQLLAMEEILISEFAKDDLAIFVGAIIGGGMKEFVFYTGNHKTAASIFEKLKKEIKHHELQCIINNDPEWNVYRTYSRQ
jgi:hypothetical protein